MKIKNILSSIIAFAVVLSVALFTMTACNLSLNIPSGNGGGNDKKPAATVNYTVSFDSDGGSAVAAKTVASGSKVSLPESPTKPGYIFAGWYLGEELWVFSEHTVKEAVTLKAKWIADTNENTVSFNSDGGTVVPSKIISASGKIGMPEPPTKTGYSFLGWFNGDREWNFATDVATSSITLTAKWEITAYPVTYELGEGAVNADGNPASYTVDDSVITLGNPSRDGFIFLGWTYGEVEEPTKNVGIGGGEVGALHFVAHWEAEPEFVTYKISYELGGGTNAEGNPKTYTAGDGGEIITVLPPSRNYYEFIGWTTEDISTPTLTLTVNPECDEGDKTLVANWKPISYSIKYVLFGGEHIGNSISYTAEDLPLSINPASKSDLHFVGWYKDAEYSMPLTTINACENLTLYAKFIKTSEGVEYTLDEALDAYIVTGFKGTGAVYIANTYAGADGIERPVVAIANDVFKGSSISKIVIPEGVVSIGDAAFSGCITLTDVSLPSTLEYVGSGAFNGCTAISASYTLCDNVYYLGSEEHPYTVVMSTPEVSARTVTIQDGAKIIYSGAFENANKITPIEEIILPDGITAVCDNAFSNLTSLSTLEIPESIKTAGQFAFLGCTALSYTTEGGVTYLGNSQNKYLIIISAEKTLSAVQIKAETKIISAYAFYGCSNNLAISYIGQKENVYVNPTGNDIFFKTEDVTPEE